MNRYPTWLNVLVLGILMLGILLALPNVYGSINAVQLASAAGGYVIADDYGLLEPARRAVDEFRADNGISAPLTDIDGHGHFWRKPG